MSKVFIGMTAYNGARFIESAILSLIDQSFTDWTLLISDDGSKDATQEICERLASKDRRIRYHRQGTNLGMFPNFKYVLDQAAGDYFMWAAQDDLWDKDFLRTCVQSLENNRKLGFAMSIVADVDSFGRTLREMPDVRVFDSKTGALQVARYILQPEILGRCNMMYSLFRLEAIRATWQAFPQRHVWGSDYLFVLAAISRFPCAISEKVLFKKRHGGYSSPDALKSDDPNAAKKIAYGNPKNGMFPLGRFTQYFRGHMEALRGTPYRPLATILLLCRLPRAVFIRIKQKIS